MATPFLDFGARATEVWMLLPLLYATVLLAAVGWWAEFAWRHAGDIEQDGRSAVLLLVAMILAVAGLAWLVFGRQVVRWVWAVRRVAVEQAAGRTAMAWYGDRYLGLYAHSDEAINGLRRTVRFRTRILPRRGGLFGPLGATWRARLLAPWKLFVRVLLIQPYDAAVAPLVDRFICARVAERAQGNDLTAQELISVTAGPPGWPAFDALPVDVESPLMDRADQAVRESAHQVRLALGEATMGGDAVSDLFIGLKGAVGTSELVHVSYFEDPAVRELLARQVIDFAGADPKVVATALASGGPAPAWLVQARAAFAARVGGSDGSGPASSGRYSGGETLLPRWVFAAVTTMTLGLFVFVWGSLTPAPIAGGSYQEINTDIFLKHADRSLWTASLLLGLGGLVLLVGYGRAWWRHRTGRGPAPMSAVPARSQQEASPPPSTRWGRILRAAAGVVLLAVVSVGVGATVLFAALPLQREDAAARGFVAASYLSAMTICTLLVTSMQLALAAEWPGRWKVQLAVDPCWIHYILNLWVVPIPFVLGYAVVEVALREYTDEYQLALLIRNAPTSVVSADETGDSDAIRAWARALARARRYRDALGVTHAYSFGRDIGDVRKANNQIQRDLVLVALANGDRTGAQSMFEGLLFLYGHDDTYLGTDLLISERIGQVPAFLESLRAFENQESQTTPSVVTALCHAAVWSRLGDEPAKQRWLARAKSGREQSGKSSSLGSKLPDSLRGERAFVEFVPAYLKLSERTLSELTQLAAGPEGPEAVARGDDASIDPEVKRLVESGEGIVERGRRVVESAQVVGAGLLRLKGIRDSEARLASARFLARSFPAWAERYKFFELVRNPKLWFDYKSTRDALLGQHAQVCADLHDFDLAREEVRQIGDLEERSTASVWLACRLADVGRIREAIHATEPCDVAKRLRAFAMILDRFRLSTLAGTQR
ncbi:MAG: hypothetical protein ACLQGP_32480 [Isosphaeraceae bacterium]